MMKFGTKSYRRQRQTFSVGEKFICNNLDFAPYSKIEIAESIENYDRKNRFGVKYIPWIIIQGSGVSAPFLYAKDSTKRLRSFLKLLKAKKETL